MRSRVWAGAADEMGVTGGVGTRAGLRERLGEAEGEAWMVEGGWINNIWRGRKKRRPYLNTHSTNRLLSDYGREAPPCVLPSPQPSSCSPSRPLLPLISLPSRRLPRAQLTARWRLVGASYLSRFCSGYARSCARSRFSAPGRAEIRLLLPMGVVRSAGTLLRFSPRQNRFPHFPPLRDSPVRAQSTFDVLYRTWGSVRHMSSSLMHRTAVDVSTLDHARRLLVPTLPHMWTSNPRLLAQHAGPRSTRGLALSQCLIYLALLPVKRSCLPL
ncbi:hypothetical protein BV20DRAFT_102850 [Pilatotrama ljubarskyi]|nr:hypothetical protein BV20DRAFT_102850 [Pilatotrama ljubarskyi]